MKKKMLFVMTTIVAFALFVPSVMAASTPELVTIAGKNILLANGTAVTIEASDDEDYGALVKWEGGQEYVPADVTIFGGYHYNPDTEVDTSITMNGGTVKNIIGGGLHQSKVGTATIVINGGTVTAAIMGGGYDGFVGYNNCTHEAANLTAELAETSTVRVEYAEITINGGNLDKVDIFGGGGGYSYTGSATITVNDHEGTIEFLIASGSNGHTADATINVEGGDVTNLFSVNRGSMDSAEMNVNGGTVENAYVGTLTANPDNPVVESAVMNITGGQVTNVEAGKNATDFAELNYSEGTVTNVDESTFKEENVIETVTVTMVAVLDGEENSELTVLPKGYTLTTEEVEELELLGDYFNEYFEEEGLNYVFKGFYLDKEGKTEVDFTEVLDENVTWYILFDEKEAEELPPKTGDINLVLLIGTIVVGAAGAVIVSKKRFAKGN